ncbi:YCF1 [Symbiodinium sp. CCMP2456]|nr:YCF1 [Symbiodinium sp. CCMP2456]
MGPPSESPQKKRAVHDEGLSLEAIRDVVRGEIQGAVTGLSDRVAAVERNLQQHNDRTFQAVETLSTNQADQALRIADIANDTKTMAGRISFLETTVKSIQASGSTPSTADTGRVPALIMGGWPPETQASEVLQKANEMARDLQLQLNMSDAFVPGVRRGFVLIPTTPQDGENDEAMRQRMQTCIRRVAAANVTLGRKPDGNGTWPLYHNLILINYLKQLFWAPASTRPLLPPSEWRSNPFGLGQPPLVPDDSEAETAVPNDNDVVPQHMSPGDASPIDDDGIAPTCPASTSQSQPATEATSASISAPPGITAGSTFDPATTGETPSAAAAAPAEQPTQDDDDDSLDEWESDTDDEQADTEQDPQLNKNRGDKPQRRPAGHGSQRVKNKARKSDVKKLWEERGWPRKPAWLTWRKALEWLKRGEIPPSRQPRATISEAHRAALSNLLNSHHYTYDSAGNIIPQPPNRQQQPQAQAAGSSSGDPSPQQNNPYNLPPHQRPDLATSSKAAGPMTEAGQPRAAQQNRSQAQSRSVRFSLPRGDGVDKYPVVKLPRPPTQEPVVADLDPGDLLFYQPPPRPDGSQAPEEVAGLEHPGKLSDLEAHSAIAVSQRRAPEWTATRNTEPMRSTIRTGANTQDLSWLAGAPPTTLPPVFPLRRRSILTLRGVATGAWRGTVTDLRAWQFARHPRRLGQEPTLVIYNTMSGSAPGARHLPHGTCLTMLPVGPWVASTRVELGAIKTPQLWLVMIDATSASSSSSSSSNNTGAIPLTVGMTFWLQWNQEGQEWRRRPRFDNDIEILGGYSIVPQPDPVQPPLPPERHDPTQRGHRGINPAMKAKAKATVKAKPKPRSTTPTSDSSRPMPIPPEPASEQPGQARADPLLQTEEEATETQDVPGQSPPGQSGGISDSETSWPSEDPPMPPPDQPPADDTVLLQTYTTKYLQPWDSQDGDSASFMQRGQQGTSPTQPDQNSPTTWTSPALSTQILQLQQEVSRGSTSVLNVLRLLRALLHDLLQQSHLQPREEVTELAYQACYYLDKLQTVSESRERGEHPGADFPGGDPTATTHAAPTEIYFVMNNPLVEAEATLSNLVVNHKELPVRHLGREIGRVEALLLEGQQILRSWGRSPQAPGAPEGDASLSTALQSLSFSHLAIAEGGLASTTEALTSTWHAVSRASAHMDALLAWIQTRLPVLHTSHPNLALAQQLQYVHLNSYLAQLLEQVLPFLEHQSALVIQEAHSLLFQWTTAIWGMPIVLTAGDSPQHATGGQPPSLPGSEASTVLLPNQALRPGNFGQEEAPEATISRGGVDPMVPTDKPIQMKPHNKLN